MTLTLTLDRILRHTIM